MRLSHMHFAEAPLTEVYFTMGRQENAIPQAAYRGILRSKGEALSCPASYCFSTAVLTRAAGGLRPFPVFQEGCAYA